MRIIVIVTDQEKLTPRSRVIFEKLRAAHSITKFPVFCVQPEASLPCSQESTRWKPHFQIFIKLSGIENYLCKVATMSGYF